ncbi:LIC12048 family lipoprotein, partial [Leptospira wolffii]
MKMGFEFGKRFLAIAILLPFVATCLSDFGFGKGDVDLSKATWLVAQKVPFVAVNEGVPGQPVTPVHDIFSLPLGTKVSVQAVGGTIDPTGTTIVNDFDGDGILNSYESNTNVWVADYPDIDTVINPPVTMQIEVLKTDTGSTDQITSEIKYADTEETKNDGSEKIHQNEVNLRTVQFEDTYSSSNSLNLGSSSGQNYGIPVGSAGLNYGTNSSSSWGFNNSTSKTVTKWADKPFKNNIDKDARSLKSEVSSQNARKYRTEKASKSTSGYEINPKGGYIRAALYIKNRSVNMPVKLSHILCSLMFETAEGDLVPVNSFYLKNQDYSDFEVSVYGGSEFGPYVVELNGLNTAEIEKAITAGYVPKIFIVDYQMTHVADSNYRSTLLNFTGDNLKIIEENAKGRTALIKIYGPNIRESYRVAAFEITGDTGCNAKNATGFKPGTTLREALNRIACSGIEIQYQDYVVDLSDVAPTLGDSRIYVKGIKSIGGISNTVPFTEVTSVGSDGVSRTAYVQTPFSQLTDEQKQASGVWAIFSKGKYYNLTEYLLYNGAKVYFDPTNPRKASVLQGVDSKIWAGDYFDIVYISASDYIKTQESFGTSPLETAVVTQVNTAWDLPSLGEQPYNPNVKSTFLGTVGFGEKVTLDIKLNKTQYLNPNFGVPVNAGPYSYFQDFSYSPKTVSTLFGLSQIMDFEISLGYNGTRTDWFHIGKDLNNTDPKKPKTCSGTAATSPDIDYVNQSFQVCIQLPTASDIVDPSTALIRLYFRPALNSAYRRTIWPLNFHNVPKLRAYLASPNDKGVTSLRLSGVYGSVDIGDTLYITGDSTPYTILTVGNPDTDGAIPITVDTQLQTANKKTTQVSIPGTLSAPDVRLSVDSAFYTDWNTLNNANVTSTNYNTALGLPLLITTPINCTTIPFHPLNCLGFTADMNAINWMGNYNYGVGAWNSGTDGGSFDSFLANGLFRLTATSTNRSYRLESSTNDFVVNENVSVTTLSEPQTVTYGDIAFTVWRQDNTLQGKFMQISTGTVLAGGAQVKLNTANATGKFVVKADSGKASILWENGADIYIAFRDLTAANFPAIGSEIKVVTRPNTSGGLALAMGGGGKAIAVWSVVTTSTSFFTTTTYHTVVGRNFQGDAAGTSGTGFGIALVSGVGMNCALNADSDGGNTAIVVVGYGVDSNIVNGYTYDFATGTKQAGPVNLSGTTGAAVVTSVAVNATAGKAFVVWRRSDTTAVARVYDLTANAAMGPNAFGIAGNTSAISTNAIAGYGLLTFSSTKNTGIYLRVVDLSDGLLEYTTTLQLDTSKTATSRKPGGLYLVSGNIISLWEHLESSKRTIRGRAVTLGANLVAKGAGEFFVSTTNYGNQTGPKIAVKDTTGFVVWWATD